MNAHVLRAESPGKQVEIPPAWPHLDEIRVPTLIMIGRLDAEDIVAINEPAAKIIPNARLAWLDNVAHVPQLEGDPTTLNEIVRFIDSLR